MRGRTGSSLLFTAPFGFNKHLKKGSKSDYFGGVILGGPKSDPFFGHISIEKPHEIALKRGQKKAKNKDFFTFLEILQVRLSVFNLGGVFSKKNPQSYQSVFSEKSDPPFFAGGVKGSFLDHFPGGILFG